MREGEGEERERRSERGRGRREREERESVCMCVRYARVEDGMYHFGAVERLLPYPSFFIVIRKNERHGVCFLLFLPIPAFLRPSSA